MDVLPCARILNINSNWFPKTSLKLDIPLTFWNKNSITIIIIYNTKLFNVFHEMTKLTNNLLLVVLLLKKF